MFSNAGKGQAPALDPDAPHYSDVHILGQGGMGQVLRATDTILERNVAIKTLHEDFMKDAAISERFMLEARCTGQLDHPGIPPVYEMGLDENGRPYFAMKLIKGETLGQVISKLKSGDAEAHKVFTFERRLAIGISLCEALSYAHSLGWIHRDIKPDNVMVGPFGEIYLTDWGIAKKWVEKGAGEAPAEETAKLTMMGQCIGTPGYCSPEQLTGPQDIDPRSDVFALGVTLYELFTLEPAFAGKGLNALLMGVLNTTPPMADSLTSPHQGRVAREVAYVLVKALAKAPEERYQSVEELRQAIQLVIDGEFPVQCFCTGTKRSLGALAEFVDNYRGLAAVLVVFWFFAPILLAVLMWYILPH